MLDKNAARAEAQVRTLVQATRWGQEWTGAELELVVGFADEPVEEVAHMLGRTVYAVNGVRQALREGRPVGPGSQRQRAQAARARREAAWPADDPRWG